MPDIQFRFMWPAPNPCASTTKEYPHETSRPLRRRPFDAGTSGCPGAGRPARTKLRATSATIPHWNKRPGFDKPRFDKKVVVKKKVVKKHHWARGNRVPAWQRHYVVRDYDRYGLRRPAYGQQWVKVDNDFLLVSIASGIVAGIIAAQ